MMDGDSLAPLDILNAFFVPWVATVWSERACPKAFRPRCSFSLRRAWGAVGFWLETGRLLINYKLPVLLLCLEKASRKSFQILFHS